MILRKDQAERLGIKETLNLKEIILNAEGYFKISSPKKTDLILILLYFFAIIGVINTTMWYIYHLN